MKNILNIKNALLALAGMSLISCTPNAKQLKEAIEKDPSIVFTAIEKDPEKFIEVVNKAARDAQSKGAEKAQQQESAQREEEFKNPLKPEVQDGRAIKGPANAPITIVEYSDFECPYCSRGFQTIQEVLKNYPDKVRVVFKHLPLDFHPKAMPAAQYFEAIALQSPEKAYKWHDMIFEDQNSLKSKGEAFMKDAARKVGADVKKIEEAIKGNKVQARIAADMEEAKKFEFSGTPGYLINGVSLKGAYPYSEFKVIIDKHLAAAGK